MPIRRQHRYLYPIDWQQITDIIRFDRAQSRCECCARPHGKLVYHLGDGRWWDEDAGCWRNGQGRTPKRQPPAPAPETQTTRVFLATAHLDHNPSHNTFRNLKAFCQRCHILHDREEHRRQRRLTYLMARAIGDLFTGRYYA